MRKFNAALTAVIMLLFIAHAVFGSFQMLGITGAVLEHLARGMAVLVILHALIGVKLTIDTLKTQKEAGVSYFKENKLFWIRRISGFGVMLFLCFHMFAFGGKNANGVYRLYAFTGFKLAANLLLVLSLAIHIITNIRPLTIALGSSSLKQFVYDFLLVTAVLMVIAAVAFEVYYLRWNSF